VCCLIIIYNDVQDGTAVDGSGAAPPLPPTAASGTAVPEISVGAPGSEVIKLDLEVISCTYV
jgi:hypothetical protein